MSEPNGNTSGAVSLATILDGQQGSEDFEAELGSTGDVSNDPNEEESPVVEGFCVECEG